jgi:hypothetical protein
MCVIIKCVIESESEVGRSGCNNSIGKYIIDVNLQH